MKIRSNKPDTTNKKRPQMEDVFLYPTDLIYKLLFDKVDESGKISRQFILSQIFVPANVEVESSH